MYWIQFFEINYTIYTMNPNIIDKKLGQLFSLRSTEDLTYMVHNTIDEKMKNEIEKLMDEFFKSLFEVSGTEIEKLARSQGFTQNIFDIIRFYLKGSTSILKYLQYLEKINGNFEVLSNNNIHIADIISTTKKSARPMLTLKP